LVEPEKKRLGTDKKETQSILDALSRILQDKMREMSELKDPEAQKKAFVEYLELERNFRETQGRFLQSYSVNVLEAIAEESRTLRYLTIVLIALTTVLAVFTGFLLAGVKL